MRGKRKQMCPNPDCERHAQPTGLMGGCDCGAQLVAYLPQFVEPTTEQLARFAVTCLKPDWVGPVDVVLFAQFLDLDPEARADIRAQHRQFQQAVYDREARS